VHHAKLALMRCACIDIGSNTTRLLVAEPADGALHEVLSQRAFTRLTSGQEIPPDKIELVARTVAQQVAMARECEARRIRAVATAAIRDAPNRAALCAAVKAAAGVEVAVLCPEDEARLAFAGATRTLRDAPPGTIAVVDVGGGSSEIVVGTMAGGVTWSASLRVGSGYLADHYLRSDPPAADQLDNVRRHVGGVFEGLAPPHADVAYAVGGSATSLRRLVGADLRHDTLARGMRLLASRSMADIAQRYELHPERVRVLAAGMTLLDEASRVLGLPLRIASGGLREGVLLEELAGLGG
jgi:exopolyphosphatase / guanosine-5'-triphosphate,3'-diphosphate pyrophosphatase